jgi:D-3-phosphoglycerate dehydrogenase
MPLVFSTHPLHAQAEAMIAPHAAFQVASALDGGTLAKEAEGADIVIVRAPVPGALFQGAGRLRAAIRHGAGLDMIPVDAATRAGVLVANVPGVNAGTVAEHVFFAAIALLRSFRSVDRDLRQRGWLAGREHALGARDLAGRTIGIVGFGAVGRKVAAIAAAFGLDVLVNSRRRTELPRGVAFLDLDALVRASDVLVLCCPLDAGTTGLIDRRRLFAMRRDALLVNVARGPVVDEAALLEALQEGRIGGAALDVFSTQPLPPDHPFLSFDNVLITPHVAGITGDSMMRMGMGAAEEAIRVLAGGLPLNLRNPEALEAYRRRFGLPE